MTTVTEPERAYVPVSELEALLAGEDRGVLLPAKDFDELLAAARKNAAESPRTSAAIVLRSADYTGRIVGDRLVVEGTLLLRQLQDGWAAYPLDFAGVAVERARIGEQVARLGRAGGRTVLLHETSGPIEVDLQLSAPLDRVGSDLVTSLQLAGGSAATLKVEVPAGKRLLVDGARLKRPDAIEAAAAYSVPAGGGDPMRLVVTDRGDAGDADVLVFAHTAAGLLVRPGEITWQAVTGLEVHGQTLDEFVFAVPNSLEIAGVESEGLESWRLDDAPADAPEGGEWTLVTLRYREPFDGSRRVVLRGVLTVTAGAQWAVPQLVVRGATSHVSRITVRVPADVRLEAVTADGVHSASGAGNDADSERVAASELGPSSRQVVYDAFREDFTLEFATRLKESSFQADTSTVVTLLEDRWELRAGVRLVGRFGTTFDVELSLPAAWEVTSVAVGGTPADWEDVPREAGVRTIRARLPEPLAAGASAQLILVARNVPEVWPPSVAPVEVPLPEVQLPATTLEAAYAIRYPDWFRVTPLELVGLDPVPADVAAEQTTVEGAFRRLAYTYQNGRISGRLQVAPLPTRTAVRTLALTRLDEDALRTHLEMEFAVEGGGEREWTVELPEAVGTDLRFRVLACDVGARLVEQKPEPPIDGRIPWRLRFDRRVRGDVLLGVDLRTVRDEEPTTVPLPVVPGAERHHGFVAVEAGPRQRIDVKAEDAGGEPLWARMPTEIPQPVAYVPRERVVTARRYVLPGARVAVGATRFDRVAVPTAVCRSMEIATAIGGRGIRRHRLHAILSTSGIAAVGLQLPEESTIWSATVDGRPMELKQIDGVHSIAWPPADPGHARTLEVHYATPDGDGSTLSLPTPQLLQPVGQREWGAIAVLEYEWTVHSPTGTVLASSRGDFQPTRELPALSVLGEMQRSLERVALRDFGERTTVLVVLVAVLFLLTMAIRQWGPVWPLATTGVVAGVIVLVMAVSFVQRGGIGGADEKYATASKSAPAAADYDDWAEGAGEGEAAPSGGEYDWQILEEPEAEHGRLTVDAPVAPEPTLKPDADPNDDESPPTDPASRQPMERPTTPNRFGNEDDTVSGELLSELADRRRIETEELAQREERGERNGQPVIVDESRSMGGRLSVAVAFEPPSGDATTFRYVGTAGSEATLVVDVVDRRTARTWCVVAAAFTALVFWILRRVNVVSRTLVVLVAFTLSLGIGPLLAASMQPVAEGLFVGTVVGLLLWVLLAVHDVLVPEEETQPETKAGPTAAASAVLLLMTLGWGGGTVRADDPFADQPEMARSAKAATPAKSDAGWTVIVPYEDGADPLAGDRVLVPREAYERLRRAARQPVEGADARTPIVSSARYTGRLVSADDPARARVAIEATFVVYGFDPSPAPVDLPVGTVAVRSAREGNRTVALRPAQDGVRIEVGEGRHEITLAFDVAARVAGPAGRFQLHVPDVPAGTFEFELPGEDLLVRVDGAANTFRLDAGGETPRIVVPFGRTRGNRTTIEWRPRTDAGVAETVVHVDTRTTVELDDLGTSIRSRFVHDVRRGAVTELRFRAPAAARVRRIAGPDVGGWSFEGEGDDRVLSVLLRRPVDDETTLDVELFGGRTPASGTVAFPAFGPLDVVRETGTIGVAVAPQLAARVTEADGLQRIDVDELPSEESQPSAPFAYAFRYVRRPISLALAVERRPPRAKATSRHWFRIGRHDVRVDSRLVFELDQSPRQRLAVRIPEGFVPLGVESHQLDDWYTRGAGAERELVVEFSSTRSGSVELVLRGETQRTPDDPRVEIDVPRPLGVDNAEAAVGVFVAEGLRLDLEKDATGDWRRRETTDRRLEANAVLARRDEAAAAFVLTTDVVDPANAVCAVAPAIVKWTGGDVLHLLTVDDDKVSSVFVLEWRFTGAAAETFSFSAPEEFAERLEFVAPPLRRVEEAAPAEGRVRWTLHVERPVEESFLVVARAVAPPAADRLLGPVPILLAARPDDVDAFDPVDVQNRHAVAVNWSRRRLELQPDEALEPVNVRDIAFLDADSRYRDQLARATTLVRLRDRTTVPAWRLVSSQRSRTGGAAVRLAELTTVFDSDGTWRGRGVYHLENRDRQFLALVLPEGVRPLAARVDGRARTLVTRKVGEQTLHMVPIPLSTPNRPRFEVAVIFAGGEGVGRLGRALGLLEQSIRPPAPRVVAPEESPEYGIPVGRTTWTVHLPKGWTARADEDVSRNSFSPLGDGEDQDLDRTGGLLGQDVGGGQSSLGTYYLDETRSEQQFELANDLYLENAKLPTKAEERTREDRFELHLESKDHDGRGKPDDGKSGEAKPGSGKPGEGQPGEGKPGQGQPGRGGQSPGGEGREARQEQVQQLLEDLEKQLEREQRFEQPNADDSERSVAEEAVDLRPGNGLANASNIMGGQSNLPGDDVQAAAERLQPPESVVPTGSLSLDFDLPTEGETFTFTKSGGDPKLGLLVRRDDAVSRGIALGWAGLWVLLLLAACAVASRGEAALVTFVVAAVAVLGALAFLFTREAASAVGFVTFLAAGIVLCVRFAKPATPNEGA